RRRQEVLARLLHARCHEVADRADDQHRADGELRSRVHTLNYTSRRRACSNAQRTASSGRSTRGMSTLGMKESCSPTTGVSTWRLPPRRRGGPSPASRRVRERRLLETAVGHEPADVARRRDVEGGIERGGGGRRDGPPRYRLHLLGAALLDRYAVAVGERRID